MIIWSGYGFLVGVIVFVDSLIAELITRLISGDNHFYNKNSIPFGCSLLLSGVIIFLLHNYFDNKKKEQKGTYIFDKITMLKAIITYFLFHSNTGYI
ncbi:MAG: hypothetical protein ABI861_12185 [Panacibacter sp.]